MDRMLAYRGKLLLSKVLIPWDMLNENDLHITTRNINIFCFHLLKYRTEGLTTVLKLSSPTLLLQLQSGAIFRVTQLHSLQSVKLAQSVNLNFEFCNVQK